MEVVNTHYVEGTTILAEATWLVLAMFEFGIEENLRKKIESIGRGHKWSHGYGNNYGQIVKWN